MYRFSKAFYFYKMNLSIDEPQFTISSFLDEAKHRVKLFFAPGLEIGFVDRERALKQVFEWGEKGTWHPVVVFGPEGCGKTTW